MEQKPVVHWNSAMTVAFSHAHLQWALLKGRVLGDFAKFWIIFVLLMTSTSFVSTCPSYVFEVQLAIRPNSPLSGAAVVIRLGARTDEEGKMRAEVWSKKTKKHAHLRLRVTTRTQNDCFVHKTYDLSHAKCG